MSSPAKEQYRSELRRIDWDFTGESGQTGFAAYHWYPARYVPQLAGILISYFSEPGETVLDPFCGSGTTLVEAYKSGRIAIGVDINPIAVIIAQAKLITFDEKEFDGFARTLMEQSLARFVQSQMSNSHSINYEELVPNYEENVQWFHAETLQQLALIWSVLQQHESARYFNVGRAAFSAILNSCCSQDKHYSWVCDNVKPKTLTYKNAFTKFREKLEEYKASAKDLHLEAAELQDTSVNLEDFQIKQGDCITVLDELPRDSVDLAVTSPPYYSVTDYVTSMRLSNLWFGFDGKTLRQHEIGARCRRQNKDAFGRYIEEMRQSFSAVSRVLKQGRFCCVVIGESHSREPYMAQFEAMCNDIGLELCDSLTRKVPKQRAFTSVNHEKILILRKA
jgi:DNA modification methylase